MQATCLPLQVSPRFQFRRHRITPIWSRLASQRPSRRSPQSQFVASHRLNYRNRRNENGRGWRSRSSMPSGSCSSFLPLPSSAKPSPIGATATRKIGRCQRRLRRQRSIRTCRHPRNRGGPSPVSPAARAPMLPRLGQHRFRRRHPCASMSRSATVPSF